MRSICFTEKEVAWLKDAMKDYADASDGVDGKGMAEEKAMIRALSKKLQCGGMSP